MTWKDLMQELAKLSPEQLDKPLMALIDNEPWEGATFHISDENDDWKPNQPYLLYT